MEQYYKRGSHPNMAGNIMPTAQAPNGIAIAEINLRR